MSSMKVEEDVDVMHHVHARWQNSMRSLSIVSSLWNDNNKSYLINLAACFEVDFDPRSLLPCDLHASLSAQPRKRFRDEPPTSRRHTPDDMR